MSCHVCATAGEERAAMARCRICFLTVCSQHLGEAMRRTRRRGDQQSCGHLFAAHGWLAGALRRPAGMVATGAA